ASCWPWVPNALASWASWSVLWPAWPLARLLPRRENRNGAAAPAIFPQSGPGSAPWTVGAGPIGRPVAGTVCREGRVEGKIEAQSKDRGPPRRCGENDSPVQSHCGSAEGKRAGFQPSAIKPSYPTPVLPAKKRQHIEVPRLSVGRGGDRTNRMRMGRVPDARRGDRRVALDRDGGRRRTGHARRGDRRRDGGVDRPRVGGVTA